MTLGQLFMPMLQKVLPILNGLMIALKRLFTSFAQILGIKLDLDAFGQGYSDITDEMDDLSDGLDGVADSAKKAKAGLRAFDELKTINMPDTSDKSSGAGSTIDLTKQIMDATAEYEKVWQEAFDKMQNIAEGWADRIEKALEPVKKIFKDFAVGDFFQAGKDTSNLVAGIFDFFSRAIDRVDWYKIGKNIGEFLEGVNWTKIFKSVGQLIWKALKAVLKVWKSSFDAAPIETGIITAIGLLKFRKLSSVLKTTLTPKINSALGKISSGLTLGKLGVGIASVFGEFTLISDALEGLTTKTQGVGSALAEIVTGAGLAVGALKLIGLANP
ncbi:MAG: hypothetical protein NC489_35335, partial [Ruminococcus flavefaciens]|nr:hypothetical protein [Ruminococcus flavefaciens]